MISAPVHVLDRIYQVFGYEDDPQFLEIAKRGESREFPYWALRHLVKPGMRCIDVGAYAGLVTLAMAQLGGEVIAYEASPRQHRALCQTVSGVAAALCEIVADGRLATWVEAGTSSHSLLDGSEHSRRTVVLDSHQQVPANIIKIDAEGAELAILAGARELLASSKPTVIMEFNSFAFIHYRGLLPVSALWRITTVFPYVYYFKDRTRELRQLRDHETWLAYNYLHGMVDDLLCSFEPIDLPAPPPEPEPYDARSWPRKMLSAAAARVGI